MTINPAELYPLSRDLAREHYDTLAYHNWGHVESMLGYVDRRIPVLRSMGVEIDETEVKEAIVWHDADYKTDSIALGYSSKELYSAYLAEQHEKQLGYEDDFIEKVKVDIAATQLGNPRPTNEANLVVEADMHNVAGNRNTFLLTGLKLARENLQLGKVLPTDVATYMSNSAKFLMQYFTEPFVYTTQDGSIVEMGNFTAKATRNISKMGAASLKTLLEIPDCASSLPDQWRSIRR